MNAMVSEVLNGRMGRMNVAGGFLDGIFCIQDAMWESIAFRLP
jgi:hypothetical protein